MDSLLEYLKYSFFLFPSRIQNLGILNIFFLGGSQLLGAFFKGFVYLFDRERACKKQREEQAGGATGRGKGVEGEAGSPLSRMSGSNSEPWNHDMSQRWTLNLLSHPGAQMGTFLIGLARSLTYINMTLKV